MCGIFGCINNEYTTFKKGFFNALGIANDKRGGDSCGIFIDKKVEYGIGKTKLYEDFFLESELLQETSKCHIALGHCRAGSAGYAKTIKEAQPVVIKKDDEIEFVVIHNGTIHNQTELAKKYIPDVDIIGMTDSQVMTHIFYHKGYDVLSEYNGSAVFVIVDYRHKKPKIYFWKGESKQSAGSKDVSEERPFYHVKIDGTLIFSSIPSFIEAFAHEECWTIKSNALIEYKDEDLYIIQDYDRSNMQQSKVYISNSSSTNKSTHKGGWSQSNYLYHNGVGDFMYKGEKLHGKKFCTSYGTCFETDFNSTTAMWCYFYNGVLLQNERCFDLIERVRNELVTIFPEYQSYQEFCRDFAEIIGYFSYNPLRLAEEDGKYYCVNENFLWEPFSGTFSSPFTDYSLKTLKNGNVVSSVYKNGVDTFNDFKNVSKSFFIDEASFINLINDMYNVGIRL